MKKYSALIAFISIFIPTASICWITAPHAEKSYPLYHTNREWVQIVNAQTAIRNYLQHTRLPADEVYWCDSVLQAQSDDIDHQIVPLLIKERDSVTAAATAAPIRTDSLHHK